MPQPGTDASRCKQNTWTSALSPDHEERENSVATLLAPQEEWVCDHRRSGRSDLFPLAGEGRSVTLHSRIGIAEADLYEEAGLCTLRESPYHESYFGWQSKQIDRWQRTRNTIQ